MTEVGLFTASWHVFFSIRQPISHLICLWTTIFIEKRGNTVFFKKESENAFEMRNNSFVSARDMI